jgi:outer membrane autotransporter protein
MSGTGDFTKSGAGSLSISGTNTFSGMTTVRDGTLELGSDLLSSKDLTLFDDATFSKNGYDHSLNNGSLTVRGENATYDGDLSATNATLNFITSVNPSQALLNVNGSVDISNSTINVGLAGGTTLNPGATLSLINATGTLITTNLSLGTGIVESGVTTLYRLDLNPDPITGQLSGTVTSGIATEESKALSEGFISGVSIISQAADHVAGKGMESAVSSTSQTGNSTGNVLSSFGSFSGGSIRFNSGSHVDMNSFSLVAGLSYGVNLTPGHLTLGAFFEYGNGSYDTYNSFTNAASIHGDGNIYHIGGGILVRMDFNNSGLGHIYTEASFRSGEIHNEYNSSDLRDPFGRIAEYDSSSAYYSFHLGTGYVFNITEAASLDLSLKYLWTQQKGDSVRLSTGDQVTFEDVISSRLRLGGRFNYAINEYFSPYIGLAYEHEYDSQARATTNGFPIKAPSLEGDTGIGEIGVTFKPSLTFPLSFDLGGQGYTGKRQGITGSLQVKVEF